MAGLQRLFHRCRPLKNHVNRQNDRLRFRELAREITKDGWRCVGKRRRQFEMVCERPAAFGESPPREAHLSKLGLRKSLRGASSAAETTICGWGSHFEKSEFPSSRRREEGWRRHQENGAKPPYGRRRGGCSLSQRSEHHPVLAKSGCYAILS